MRIRIFTLRYSQSLGGFDDGPLVDLQRDREILSCEAHFFSVAEVPHICMVVSWQEAPIPAAILAAAGAEERGERTGSFGSRASPDLRAGLIETERILFDTMRRWRAELARDEGVPPYVILTNKELLAVVRTRPDSLNALGNIEGIGKAKLKRHGPRLLRALNGAAAAAAVESVKAGAEGEATAGAGVVAEEARSQETDS